MWGVLYLAILALHCGTIAAKLTEKEIESIDLFVKDTMQCWNVPGFSLAVVKDGTTVLTRGYGKAVIEEDKPATEKTVFPIASMTKQFSATLLGMLLSENGYKWNTKVREILDDFQMPSDYLTLKTTIEDIISHRTGVMDGMSLGQFTSDEAFRRIKLYDPVLGFREEILYSGIMFSVSGQLSEKLGGKAWKDLMRERVFEPLNMDSAVIYDTKVLDRGDLARPYMAEVVDGPLIYIDPYVGASTGAAAPAGGVAASAEDMAKYLEFLTKRGKDAKGNQLLPGRAIDELFSPLMVLPQPWLGGYLQLPVTPYQRTLDAYSHGWMLGYYRELRSVYHFGDIYGFDGLISLFPTKEIGVYSNANGPMGRRAVLANLLIQNYVTDILLGEEPWLDRSSVCEYTKYVEGENPGPIPPSSTIDKTMTSSRPLKEYIGTYGNLVVGNLTVSINSTTMKLQIDFGPLAQFSLFATNVDDRFAVENFGHLTFMRGLSTKDNPGAMAMFDADDKGVIKSVTMGMFDKKFIRDLKFSAADDIPVHSDCS